MPSRLQVLLADYPITVPLPVQWGEMDSYQHVNNVAYFRYFETARIALFHATGILSQDGEPTPVGPILAATSCRFKAPLKFPDQIYACARVSELDTDRFTMQYAVISERLERIAAVGDGIVVSYDYERLQKVSLPASWCERIAALGVTVASER